MAMRNTIIVFNLISIKSDIISMPAFAQKLSSQKVIYSIYSILVIKIMTIITKSDKIK